MPRDPSFAAPDEQTEPSSPRGAHARSALIEAAVEVFGERGSDSATTREIALRSKQNIATIAYHFGNKEGLYLSVAEHIRGLLLKRLEPLLKEAEAFLDSGKTPPERCLEYVQRLLSAIIASNSEMLSVTNIIAREQTHPTQAFSILFDGVLKRLHAVGARLIATYTGDQPGSAKAIVRFHALVGESLVFRFARETILRRAGWTDIGRAEHSLIEAVVNEHVELVLRGLREGRRRFANARPRPKARKHR